MSIGCESIVDCSQNALIPIQNIAPRNLTGAIGASMIMTTTHIFQLTDTTKCSAH